MSGESWRGLTDHRGLEEPREPEGLLRGQHIPVLSKEIVDGLARADSVFIDATVGDGGHAAALLEASGPTSRLLGLDQDPVALQQATKQLQPFGKRVTLVHGTFASLHDIAVAHGVTQATGILFDLGFRSSQLESERGFSFRQSSPLDMRFDPTGSLALPLPDYPALRALARRQPRFTAADVLAQLTKGELTGIFREYGEERFADRIAEAITRSRRQQRIETTDQLVETLVRALPAGARHGRLHAATRVFQALRIAVNREPESLQQGIAQALALLAPGGTLAVISFHSGEDRIVKYALRAAAATQNYTLGTKHALQPTGEERAHNPRSRSAKLRFLTRLQHDSHRTTVLGAAQSPQGTAGPADFSSLSSDDA